MHYEIERKFLITMPDTPFLLSQPGCQVWDIEQIYLVAQPGETRRVRRIRENGQDRFYRTFKRRLTDMSCEEDESQITPDAYAAYLQEVDPALHPIQKTRYRIPYENQTLEFDIFPFWPDQALLEIELPNENTPVSLPPWVTVLQDVTTNPLYKNVSLAARSARCQSLSRR